MTAALLKGRVKFSPLQHLKVHAGLNDNTRIEKVCAIGIGIFDAGACSDGSNLMNRPRRSLSPKPVSTSLEKKVQDALNESRILVLGVQVLLSFQYTSVLENAFVKLPFVSQALGLFTLPLLLLTFGLLVSPVPYHLVVWRSEDSEDVQTFVSTIVEVALYLSRSRCRSTSTFPCSRSPATSSQLLLAAQFS